MTAACANLVERAVAAVEVQTNTKRARLSAVVGSFAGLTQPGRTIFGVGCAVDASTIAGAHLIATTIPITGTGTVAWWHRVFLFTHLGACGVAALVTSGLVPTLFPHFPGILVSFTNFIRAAIVIATIGIALFVTLLSVAVSIRDNQTAGAQKRCSKGQANGAKKSFLHERILRQL